MRPLRLSPVVCMLCLLCLARPTEAVSQRVTPELFAGTWRWVSSIGGPTDGTDTPEACGCERYLLMDATGRYRLVERDSVAEYVLCSGAYAIQPWDGPLHRAADDPGSADAWISFVGWWIDYERDQLVWFAGRDTLLTCPGTAETYVYGALIHRFVRVSDEEVATLSKAPRAPRPLKKRPRRPTLDRVASVKRVDHGSRGPVPVSELPPVYPMFAKEARINGDVAVSALVARSGRVVQVRVTHPVTGLTGAAVEAMKRWVFKPALSDDQPTEAWIEVVFRFSDGRVSWTGP